jgi:hypothetical protein
MVTSWPHPKPVKGQRQTTFADQRYNHSAAFCPSRLFSTAAGAPPPPIPCPNPGDSSETAAAHCPACSALASTLDALAYNFRDGLTLPALDMPQQLAAPAPLADDSRSHHVGSPPQPLNCCCASSRAQLLARSGVGNQGGLHFSHRGACDGELGAAASTQTCVFLTICFSKPHLRPGGTDTRGTVSC